MSPSLSQVYVDVFFYFYSVPLCTGRMGTSYRPEESIDRVSSSGFRLQYPSTYPSLPPPVSPQENILGAVRRSPTMILDRTD